jgi:hypothetical protein
MRLYNNNITIIRIIIIKIIMMIKRSSLEMPANDTLVQRNTLPHYKYKMLICSSHPKLPHNCEIVSAYVHFPVAAPLQRRGTIEVLQNEAALVPSCSALRNKCPLHAVLTAYLRRMLRKHNAGKGMTHCGSLAPGCWLQSAQVMSGGLLMRTEMKMRWPLASKKRE